MGWVGVKKLAVVPTFNKQFDPAPPDDWSDRVRRRVFYDPDPGSGIDRSLRGYIEAIPYVIGGGGWQAFKFLLAGDNGIIYAVVP